MSLVFTIVTAAYARGSHHKLALEGLKRLRGPEAEAWRKVFLKNAEAFVAASKIPDDEFKDFKNHVLHPRDGYWGGAPVAARQWYDSLVENLRASDWMGAARSAGILSHYVVDPVHPFHTAQSEAENAIHRACEWSINRAFDSLRAEGEGAHGALALSAAADPNWLTLLIGQGADKSNAQYEKLIAHYDITRGVVDPPSGLDPVARRIVGELIHYASETFAVVLAMALAESGARPPEVALTPAMLLAMVKIPSNQLLKRMENAAERKLVAAMYDELKSTGTVDKTLPEDDRTIRNTYAAEVLAKKPKVDVTKVFPLPPSDAAMEPVVLPVRVRKAIEAAPVPPSSTSPPRADAVPASESATRAATATAAGLAAVTAHFRDERSTPPKRPMEAEVSEDAKPPRTGRLLARDAAIVDAPSIGPKTAERLHAAGILTVADFLAADAADLSKKLATRWIGTTTVADWQAQTKLATEVPGLRDTHTQLLVGAGYRDARTLAEADPDQLAADVLAFAASNDGRRLLRDGDPPDLEKIKGWLSAAKGALAA